MTPIDGRSGGSGRNALTDVADPSAGTALRPTATEVMGDGGSALSTARSRFRRAVPLLIGALVLAVIILVNLLPGQEEDDGPLSPGNAAPAGARAVSEVLASEGVDVTRTESFDATLGALESRDATLFLNDAQQFLSAGQVADLVSAADRSVLAAPGDRQLSALEEGFAQLGPVPFDLAGDAPPLTAGCPDEDAAAAGTLPADGTLYSGPVTCFTATVDGVPGGLYTTNADGSVAVLGAPSILSNGSILDGGSAALALRSLGASPTLVWYEPTGADVVSTGEGIDPTTLLPQWVDGLLVWLLACAVLAMLWRGRRLGPLASEPLPVVVRAAETAEGRARLYQDSRSVAHAAGNLRAATLVRLARHLRVDRTASPVEILEAATRQTGRLRPDLEQRLLHFTPTTNHELVLWAQEILEIEKEIIP
ncbi:hypothetical protein GM708_07300 [Vibrio cholerae]|nr:hypothetical protein [Vibrio cholerae]